MAELLAMMGGMGQFAAPDEKIVLKVNLLRPVEPKKAVTTHPAVVAAVGRLAQNKGASPIVADSPGSGYQYTDKTLDRFYRTCGMYEAAKEAGLEVNLDTTYRAVSFPDGRLIKRFEVITPVVEADGVFNLCKLKTHLLTGMTAAVKNNFGVIPGLAKPGYHAKLQSKNHFANMLLDLAACVSARLSIMDAVVGMEGAGPNAGDPRHIGLLLAAKSPLALDVVASEIIGLSRANNPVLLEAEKSGLLPNRLEQVQIIGAYMADLRIPDYKVPSTLVEGTSFVRRSPRWQRALEPLFKGGLTLRPRVVKGRCVACGTCQSACPVEAITMVNSRHAKVDDKECIRCYCCHEMCPHDAIELRPSLLYRIMSG
jgi:uncharacterized protein (DUF362 family)/Pyruvate/2-oxoacid:ferredoxin oxidoreductase delta subunit